MSRGFYLSLRVQQEGTRPDEFKRSAFEAQAWQCLIGGSCINSVSMTAFAD